MIVYLATYPRSGNSLLQQIFANSLCILPSAIVEGRARGAANPVWDVQPVEGKKHLATYARLGERYPYLLPGPIDSLSPERRRRLAGAPEIHAIKTHGQPFEDYLAGERVIQIVRHPGAVLWSYFRYEADRARDLPALRPVTLERVIAGQVGFGDWTDYHRTWSTSLRNVDLRLSYEAVVGDLRRAVSQVAGFLGVQPATGDLPDFEYYRSLQPGKDVRGQTEGYEQFYTREQLAALWDRHGPLSMEFGLQPPNLELACPTEQIARLVAQLG